MRGFILSLLIGAVAVPSYGDPIRNISDNGLVGRYEKFEATFDLSRTYDNPFDPAVVDVTAFFIAPSGAVRSVKGFYYQDYSRSGDYESEGLSPVGTPVWKIRFAPDETGTWTYQLEAKDAAGLSRSQSRSFRVRESKSRGFIGVSKSDPEYFAFNDGSPFFAIGENLAWPGAGGTYQYDAWIGSLAAVGGNFFRLWQAPWSTEIEWAETYPPSTRLPGDYRDGMKRAWQLDAIFDLSEKKGVAVMWCLLNHGRYSTKTDSNWNRNPYSRAANPKGGFLNRPEEFWTDPRARDYLRRNWRYLIARYAHHTALHSWEIFNEMEWIDNYKDTIPESVSFHKDMAFWLRKNDPYGHLVTTSYAEAFKWPKDVWEQGMDFAQQHHYGGADTAGVVEGMMAELRRLHPGKPVWMGEKGLATGQGGEEKADPSGVFIHHLQWASLLAKAAGGGFPWWFDNYIHPRNLYFRWKGIARFLWGEDLDKRGYAPVTFQVETPVQGALGLSPGMSGWGAKSESREFTLSPDGLLTPPESQLATFIYSAAKPEFRNPPTFKINLAAPARFKVTVGEASKWGPNLITLRVDGKKSKVDNEPVTIGKVYEVALDKGAHRVEVDSTGTDWFTVLSYSLDPYVSALRCRALVGRDKVLGRVQSTFFLGAFSETPEIRGGVLRLSGLGRDGMWDVDWWDAARGEKRSATAVTVKDGSGEAHLPPITTDLAFKARPRTGSPTETPVPWSLPVPMETPVPAVFASNNGDLAAYSFEDGKIGGWALTKGDLKATRIGVFAGKGALTFRADLTEKEEVGCFLSNRTLSKEKNRLVFHVRTSGGEGPLDAKIYLQGPNWEWLDGGTTTLKPGVWNTLAWEVSKAAFENPCRRVGIHFQAPKGFKGEILLDSIDLRTVVVPTPTPPY